LKIIDVGLVSVIGGAVIHGQHERLAARLALLAWLAEHQRSSATICSSFVLSEILHVPYDRQLNPVSFPQDICFIR
jgi:hypothetical protein